MNTRFDFFKRLLERQIRDRVAVAAFAYVTLAVYSQTIGHELLHHSSGDWVCPNCHQCSEPLKFGCCEPDKTKKPTFCYGVKKEDVCFAKPCARNCISKHLESAHPSLWDAWGVFTGGVVREKKSLQKTVDSKEVSSQKCVVHYECPCCKMQFVLKDPIEKKDLDKKDLVKKDASKK